MFLDPTEIKTEVIKGTTMPAFKHSKYFNFDLVTSQVGDSLFHLKNNCDVIESAGDACVNYRGHLEWV